MRCLVLAIQGNLSGKVWTGFLGRRTLPPSLTRKECRRGHNDSPGTHVVFRLSVVPMGDRRTLLRFWVQAELMGFNRLLEPLAKILLRARAKTLVDIKEYVEASTS